jgi:hypothetical protein
MYSILSHCCTARNITALNFHYFPNNISSLYIWKMASREGTRPGQPGPNSGFLEECAESPPFFFLPAHPDCIARSDSAAKCV